MEDTLCSPMRQGFIFRSVEGGETHPIKVPEEFKVSGTTWFPDGGHIMVALAKSGQKSGLWDLSVLGGGFRGIADDGFAPAISPDGKRVAFVKGSKTHQQLWIMGSDGSQPEMLAGDEGDYFGQVVWSPNGQRIAYSRGKLTYGYGIRLGIETMDIQSRSVRTLSWPDGLNLPLAWSSNNRLIYCANEHPSRQADSSLWSAPLDRQGQIKGAAARISTNAGVVVTLSVSADGKRLVVLEGVSQPDVMSHDWKKEGPRSARRSALPWMTGGIFPLTGVGMARSLFSSLTAVANSVSTSRPLIKPCQSCWSAEKTRSPKQG